MARYTGPRARIGRRFGIDIYGTPKALERRNFPPGVHGAKSRRKQSEYGVAMGEKQKLKHMYGVLERQFRLYYETAARKRGVTGDTLLQLLETRLDNVVFRLGFANTRRLARQFVTHGHIIVNGRKANIPSFQVKAGDVVEVKNVPKSRQVSTKSLEKTQINPTVPWLLVDKDNHRGTVSRIPTREEIGPIVNERLVVELYSR
ncbi:MAG: 30S ribosomal protein S4 [Verrucomicrobiales bacterium]|jgi:small subunit ribosomal protein S4|nr:30S ribosomal protein S4 [Verrucomicrobiales bacterium]